MNRVAAGILLLVCGVALAENIPEWKTFRASPDTATKRLVAEIEKMKWWDACIAFGRELRSGKSSKREEALLSYLTSERMLTSTDRGLASDRSIAVGQTECGVYASLGLPSTVNHTTRASGTRSQLVYRDRKLYIYTEPHPASAVNVVRSYQH